jgi:hypothetical protein
MVEPRGITTTSFTITSATVRKINSCPTVAFFDSTVVVKTAKAEATCCPERSCDSAGATDNNSEINKTVRRMVVTSQASFQNKGGGESLRHPP